MNLNRRCCWALAAVLAAVSTWTRLSADDGPQPKNSWFAEARRLREAADERHLRALAMNRAGKLGAALAAAEERIALEKSLRPTDADSASMSAPRFAPPGSRSTSPLDSILGRDLVSYRELQSQVAAALEMKARLHEEGEDYAAARSVLRQFADEAARAGSPGPEDIRLEVERLGRLEALGQEAREFLRKARRATALIATVDGPRGSAFCIDAGGLFLAHASALEGLWDDQIEEIGFDQRSGLVSHVRSRPDRRTSRPCVLILGADGPDEVSLPARVVRVSREQGLALLKVDPPGLLPHLELCRDRQPREGEAVISMGYPFVPELRPAEEGAPGSMITISSYGPGHQRPRTIHWVWSDPARVASVRRTGGRPWLVTLDSRPPQGCTGGPVLDSRGLVLGLLVNGPEGTGVHHVIPVVEVEAALGRALVIFEPPPVTYRARKSPTTWRIRLLAPDSLPASATVRVLVGSGGSARSFAAEPVPGEPGVYNTRVLPTAPNDPEQLDIYVQTAQGVVRGRIADSPIRIGEDRLMLSDLGHLELGEHPRGFTRRGRPFSGRVPELERLVINKDDRHPTPRRLVDCGTSLDIIFPPGADEMIPCEVQVLDGLEMLGRLSAALTVREPSVEVSGELRVSAPGPAGAGHEIRPAAIREGSMTVELPGTVRDVAVGGGGRYIALILAKQRKLAIFDINTPQGGRILPLASEAALVAAGAKKMVIAYPDLRFLQRWDLGSLRMERSEAIPIRGSLRSITMGADSAGPVMAYWVRPEGKGAFDPAWLTLIDLDTLKGLRVALPDQSAARGMSPTIPDGCLPMVYSSLAGAGERAHVRTSAGGGLFCLWRSSGFPSGFMSVRLDGEEVSFLQAHEQLGYITASPDGHVIYTASGTRRDPSETRFLPAGTSTARGEPVSYIGSPSSDDYLEVRGLAPSWIMMGAGRPGQAAGAPRSGVMTPPALPRQGPAELPRVRPVSVVVHRADGSEVLTIPDVPGMEGLVQRPASPDSDFTDDKRFHLIPQADMVVAIPPSNDRLVLLPFHPSGSRAGDRGGEAIAEPNRGAVSAPKEPRP
jgi:hypothetical protein